MAKATKSKTKQKTDSESGAAVVSKQKQDRQKVVREEILEKKEQIERGFIDIAKLLYEAYHKEYYSAWGYQDFKSYCDGELDIQYSKAMYFIKIWDTVKGLNLPAAAVESLGWTKMKDLVSVLTKKNAKAWLKKAKKMTSRELTEAVKVQRQKNGTSREPSVTTLKITMGEDAARIIIEAISEAKKLTEDDDDVLALEMICQDWMQEKGASPERSTLESIITYAKDVYGVTLTASKAASDADEETEVDDDDADDDGVANGIADDDSEGGDQDIDELLDL